LTIGSYGNLSGEGGEKGLEIEGCFCIAARGSSKGSKKFDIRNGSLVERQVSSQSFWPKPGLTGMVAGPPKVENLTRGFQSRCSDAGRNLD